MSSRWPAGILVALVVAGLAWWTSVDRGSSFAPLAPEELDTSPAEARVAVDTRATAPATSSSARSSAVSRSDDVELRCVDGVTGAAIPGAIVHVLDAGHDRGRFGWNEELRWIGANAAAEIEAHGRELVADARGIVALPRPREALVACAHREGLLGFGVVVEGELTPVRIELWPRKRLAARVVDAEGAPATCDVALLAADSNEILWRAGTDGEGRVRIEDLDALARVQGHASDALALRVLVPATPPVEVLFDLATLPEDEVELRLRAAGALVVRLVDDTGEVVTASGEVGVIALDPLGRARETSDVAVELGAPLVGGVARLAPLELCVSVRLRVAAGAMSFSPVSFDGPRESGKERVVDVRMPDYVAFVTGRFVDEVGAPRRGAICDVSAWTEGKGASQWLSSFDQRVVAGEDGRFTLVVARRDLTQEGVPAPRLRLVCEARASEAARRSGVSVLANVPTRLDAGDVVLVDTPVFARGFVRDEEGSPVAAAAVYLEALSADGSGAPWGTDETLTAADGSFVVRALCGGGPGSVWAEGPEPANGTGATSREIACGTTQAIELVIGTTGTITGLCRIDPDASRTPTFEFVREDGVRSHAWSTCAVEGGLSFRMTSVPAGRGHLVVARDGQEIARIDELEVPANGLAHDERLASIDLRGKLGAPRAKERADEIVLLVVDERGEPVPRGVVIARQGSTADVPRAGFAGGRAILLVAQGSRVMVLAPGKLARAVSAHPGTIVVLEDAPRVEIELQGVERVAAEGDELWVVLRGGPPFDTARLSGVPASAESQSSDLHPARLDAQGRARFSLPVEARYGIALRVVRRGDGSNDEYRSADTGELTVDAFDARRSSAPIVVTTALTEVGVAEITEALEEE